MCNECDDNCEECLGDSNHCISCPHDMFLSKSKCYNYNSLDGKCMIYHTYTNGCVKCNDGYYRDEFYCEQCDEVCKTCVASGSCLTCKDDYYLKGNQCVLKSTFVGCAEELQHDGCHQCQDGLRLIDGECIPCPEKCKTCDEIGKCLSCIGEEVVVDGKCQTIDDIEHAKQVESSKVTKCSFWHEPSDDGTYCKTHVVWWVILIGVIVVLLLIIICIALVYFIFNKFIRKRLMDQFFSKDQIFEIAKSNISFNNHISKNIYSDFKCIEFMNEDGDVQLKVDEEVKSAICIGNFGKQIQKVQLVPKTSEYKYSIRVEPEVAVLRKGMACEFTLYFKPFCSTKIESEVGISITSLKKGDKEINEKIPMKAETELCNKLDPDDLEEDKKLGEGSFGIVFLGTFRGNKVAIKKMKNVDNNEEALEEFSKEVAMLDKFRSEYIIHFYGASFIPNRMCMVTEFAKYGSINDLMKKSMGKPVKKRLRVQFLIDAVKGIMYLHSNGILHRDIKPDNILVVSLEENGEVNGKLTDFGSARNINMMMTNMTFTKGIGTPVYMAPEILSREHYKNQADIYSFGVTIYEVMSWNECYPQTDPRFKFPWKIVDFVSKGNRREKPDKMGEDAYELVNECWKQKPEERIDLESVLNRLIGIKQKMEDRRKK